MGAVPAVPNPKGLPILDARKSIAVEVTPPDVRKGTKLEATSCAYAVAIKRQTHCVEARVYRTVTYVTYKTKIVRFRTPEAAARELIAYDRGGSFETGEYTFRPFPKTLRLIANGGSRKPTGPKKRKGKGTRPRHLTAMVRKASIT